MKTLNITNTEELNEFERIKQNVNYEETEIIIDVRFIYEFAGYMGMGPITFGNISFKNVKLVNKSNTIIDEHLKIAIKHIHPSGILDFSELKLDKDFFIEYLKENYNKVNKIIFEPDSEIKQYLLEDVELSKNSLKVLELSEGNVKRKDIFYAINKIFNIPIRASSLLELYDYFSSSALIIPKIIIFDNRDIEALKQLKNKMRDSENYISGFTDEKSLYRTYYNSELFIYDGNKIDDDISLFSNAYSNLTEKELSISDATSFLWERNYNNSMNEVEILFQFKKNYNHIYGRDIKNLERLFHLIPPKETIEIAIETSEDFEILKNSADILRGYEVFIRLTDISLFNCDELKDINIAQIKVVNEIDGAINPRTEDMLSVEEYNLVYNSAKKIISTIKKDDSEYIKFIKIYYALARMDYDFEELERIKDDMYSPIHGAGSLYAGLIKNKVVCRGYANILNYLLKMVGIESKRINGYATDDVNNLKGYEHAWNQVKINGVWYNCDLTADANLIKQGNNPFNLPFCLKSDEEFIEHITNDLECEICPKSFTRFQFEIGEIKNFFRIIKSLCKNINLQRVWDDYNKWKGKEYER